MIDKTINYCVTTKKRGGRDLHSPFFINNQNQIDFSSLSVVTKLTTADLIYPPLLLNPFPLVLRSLRITDQHPSKRRHLTTSLLLNPSSG